MEVPAPTQAMWCGASSLTSLCLSFLIYKLVMIMIPSSRAARRISMVHPWKALRRAPSTRRAMPIHTVIILSPKTAPAFHLGPSVLFLWWERSLASTIPHWLILRLELNPSDLGLPPSRNRVIDFLTSRQQNEFAFFSQRNSRGKVRDKVRERQRKNSGGEEGERQRQRIATDWNC